MSHVRRRRSPRRTVFAASVAVLVSLAGAPAAQADTAAPTSPAVATPTPDPSNPDPSTDSPVDGPVADPTGVPGTPALPTDPASPTTPPTTTPGSSETTSATTGAEPTPEVPADTPLVSSAADVDTGDTVVGELVQAFVDPGGPLLADHDHDGHDGHDHDDHDHDHDHDHDQPLTWVATADGASVQVVTEDVAGVASGSTVAVTVGEVTEAAETEGAETDGARDVLAATVLDRADPTPAVAAAGGATTNQVTAVLALPRGASPDGTTVSQVVAQLNGPVNAFWDEQTNGAVRIGAVAGPTSWVTSTYTCQGDDYAAFIGDVARQVGWTAGAGKNLMLYVPDFRANCGGAYGMGRIGMAGSTGGTSWVGGVATDVMAHELGHNFGLGHSSGYRCDRAMESGSGCQTTAYTDYYDVMGFSWGAVGSLNVVQAARLGVLPASEVVALTPSSPATSVDLAPVASASGTRAVKLTAPDGRVYYLENRQATGQDAWLSTSTNRYGLDSGVSLRRASSGSDTSLLLDPTPTAPGSWAADYRQALPVGAGVPVAGGAFTVTVTAQGPGGATVRITPAAAVRPVSVATITGGQVLSTGASLLSPDGAHRLVVQDDGNVVVYGPGNSVVWNTGTTGRGAFLVVQTDGNVVVYAGDLRVLWNAETGGNPGSRFVLQSDGNLVLYSASNQPLWWPAKLPAQLSVGRQLATGGVLGSPSGAFRLVVQGDGNAVVYGPGRAVWSSGTNGGGARLLMQGDGNLVLYRTDGVPLWNSGTGGQPGARVAMQDDGNLVVYSAGGAPLWWTAR